MIAPTEHNPVYDLPGVEMCAKCGGKPKLRLEFGKFMVMCCNNNCQWAADGCWQDTPEKAIEVWNRPYRHWKTETEMPVVMHRRGYSREATPDDDY